jgi:hypothetical protein
MSGHTDGDHWGKGLVVWQIEDGLPERKAVAVYFATIRPVLRKYVAFQRERG